MSDSRRTMPDYLPDWTIIDVDAYLKYEAGSEPPGYAYTPCIRRGEDEEPHYTPEEEERLIKKQVNDTEGFDINFREFRCIFNYQPLDFDRNYMFLWEPETTRELMDRLCRVSLEDYNERENTKYELVKVIKANFHKNIAVAVVFYMTFEGKDPSHDEPKLFQAKVCYFYHEPPMYISCNLKPEKKVRSIETEEKEGVKKPRLAEEPAANV